MCFGYEFLNVCESGVFIDGGDFYLYIGVSGDGVGDDWVIVVVVYWFGFFGDY